MRVALLRQAQRFLSALALGDVGGGAGPAHDLALCVAEADAVQVVPAHLAAHQHAQLHGEARAAAGEEFLHRALPLRAVFRMKRRPLHKAGAVRKPGARCEAPHLQQLGREIERVARDIPVPEAGLGREHRPLVAFLGFAQRLLGTLARGDVGERAGHQGRRAFRVRKDLCPGSQPAHFPHRVDHPILHVEAARTAREARLDRVLGALTVFRMESDLRPEAGAGINLHLIGNAEQLAGARRDIHPVARWTPFPDAVRRSFERTRVALLGVAQRVLDALAIRDVAHRAGDPCGLVIGVEKNLAAAAQPTRFTGLVEDAIFDVEAFRAAREAVLNRVLDGVPVCRMKAGMRLQVGARTDFHAIRYAIQLTCMRRLEQLAGHQIPFPDAFVRAFQRARVALLGQAQRLHGAPALRHIPHGAAPAHRASRRVAQAHAVVLDPADFAVNHRAQFHAEARAGAGKELARRTEPGLHVLLH